MTTATVTRDTPVWVALSSTAHAISYVQVAPESCRPAPSRPRRWS